MDKSWILKSRTSIEYLIGLNGFLDFALQHCSINNRIKCPCPKCKFRKWLTRDEAYDHLVCKPFPVGYTQWIFHGEVDRSQQLTRETRREAVMSTSTIGHSSGLNGVHESDPGFIPESLSNASNDEDCNEIYELLHDGNEELYDGCAKYSKLSFLLKLYHIKCMCRITDKGMSMLLELLKDAFDKARIPTSFYEAKKIIKKLGLSYTNIHACPNDCMLYWGDDEHMEQCKNCQTSRWKPTKKKKKQPAKVLRYFPLKPRLQRLFTSSKTAEQMRWHVEEDNKDGQLRHPRDSEAWKSFDLSHPTFALEPRNVRLGLATDGFNPFGSLSTNYSTWPVILIPYNLPPWLCMKKTSLILSMIIPGKRQPGNDIDVYLQPLIKELQELWSEGVKTFDASSKIWFTMRAALMWTISDFPGLGTLSGWNIYTGLACPECNFDSVPLRLRYSMKWCFVGHRRFLGDGHRFRLLRSRFNGQTETRSAPLKLSGSEILNQLENINVTFGKIFSDHDKGKRGRSSTGVKTEQWRKRSVFFRLPYWQHNLVRHNLDVMHIEKNVCDNIVYTLMNEANKTKDNLNARRDLEAMGIRSELWPNEHGRYPHAAFTLGNLKKEIFLKTLRNARFPDGYASNISRCVDLKQRKLFGLKSHDSHILIQQLLPIAIRGLLPHQVSAIIVEIGAFFRHICGKVLNVDDLDKLQSRIVLALCHMEMVFPPSFFTVMVHLIVHLVDQVKLGGPVHYRWMYPIERFASSY